MLMRLRRRLFCTSILLALTLVMGCAGPKRAVLPQIEGEHRDLPDHLRVVRKGDLVKVELHSGKPEIGEVIKITKKNLVLGRASNFGYQEIPIESENIKSIALGGGATAGDAAKGVFVIVLVTAALFAVGFAFWGSVGGN